MKSRSTIIFTSFLILVSAKVTYTQELYPTSVKYFNNFSYNKKTLQKKENTIQSFCTKLTFTSINKYAAKTKIDSIIGYSSTEPRSKRTYIYDEKGQLASYTILYLVDDLWINGWKMTGGYDSLGRATSTLTAVWQDTFWFDSFLDKFYYDSAGNNILETSQLWNNTDWENSLRATNTFDSSNKQISSLSETYEDSIWVNSTRHTIEYSDGLKSRDLFEIWADNRWQNYLYSLYEYNDGDKPSAILFFNWDGATWSDYARTTFTYGITEPQTSALYEVWNNNKWEPDSRFSYSYNTENYLTYAESKYWDNGSWVSGDIPLHILNPDGFEDHILANEVFVYYANPTDIKDNNSSIQGYELLQNYPNPFNPTTTIKYALPENSSVNLTIYNLLGEKVQELINTEQSAGYNEIKWNAENYSSGIYLARLNALSSGFNKTFTQIKKMILIK